LNNEVDEVLAHAAFLDYPNINTVEPATWFEWFSTYYVAGHCTPLNSVFLHYFVAKPDYAQGCARELIRTMFNAVPDVHYCLLAVPVGVELGERSDVNFFILLTQFLLAKQENDVSHSAKNLWRTFASC
jgi:hypothetical protein